MKRRLLASLLAITFALILAGGVLAQSYSFSVPEETVHVYWNGDGSLALDYTFVFQNEPGAHAIDFVDLGLPNSSYDYNTISADVNGTSVGISSDYQGSGAGVAVDLGNQAIQAGQKGTVHVYVGRVRKVLYKDSENADYASAVFSPAWFGSQYANGTTNLTVIYHLPPGVKPDEPKYHTPSSNWPGAQEPQTALDSNGRVMYTWQSSKANAYTQYKFGASFPKSYVPEGVIVTPSASQSLNINFDNVFPCLCAIFFGFMFVGIPALSVISDRKRKLQYMPPKISIEGHGIKRGLSAVEAAILMQEPLDKVMTMILFGVVKKNAATVVTKDPLKIDVAKPLPEGIHGYEKEFLEAMDETSAASRRKKLQTMTVNLVRSVGDKMKGFSRKETVAYYKNIMERAWKQIEEAGTPEVKSQMYEEALEWTMLDKNYDDRTRRTFTGPVFVPVWWGRYDPGFGRTSSAPSGGGMPAMTSTTGKGPALPGSTFAASVVTSVQNFSSKTIGDLTGFTQNVTKTTNPPPKPSSSSYRGSSGGGGCACACACAGCACACAGGGR
jgi:hypothetical protein